LQGLLNQLSTMATTEEKDIRREGELATKDVESVTTTETPAKPELPVPPTPLDQQKPAAAKNSFYLGNHIVLMNRNGKPFLTLGPHWPLFLTTFVVFAVVAFLILVYVNPEAPGIAYYITYIVLFGHLAAYAATALLNPGIAGQDVAYTQVDSEEGPVEGGPNAERMRRGLYCQKCGVKRAPKTYHCVDCDLCIEDYDHHCPWTGKCIGGGNIIPFYVFVTLTPIVMVYAFVLTAVSAVVKIPHGVQHPYQTVQNPGC